MHDSPGSNVTVNPRALLLCTCLSCDTSSPSVCFQLGARLGDRLAGPQELPPRVTLAMSSHSHHTTLRDGTQVASWDASTVCAQCCDGVSSCVPLEPHPLGVEAPSGLSRVAQLSAAHAVGVPFIPSYCHEQGGVVRFPRQLPCPVMLESTWCSARRR